MNFKAPTQEICPKLVPHNLLDTDETYANSITDTNNKYSLLQAWANFPYKNQLDALISQIYFGNETLHGLTVPLSIIRSYSLYTQQWYMSYRFVDSFRAGACAPARKLSTTLFWKHASWMSQFKFCTSLNSAHAAKIQAHLAVIKLWSLNRITCSARGLKTRNA
jgi:hypothetical protein